jgi:hypothetical protein
MYKFNLIDSFSGESHINWLRLASKVARLCILEMSCHQHHRLLFYKNKIYKQDGRGKKEAII